MRRYDFTLVLPVRAPVLCAGLKQPAFGYSVGFIRNEVGQPIIPRDHVKGHVRHAFEVLRDKGVATEVDSELIGDWLGRGSDEEGNWESAPGRVIFDDLVLAEKHDTAEYPYAPYARICMNDETGTVQKGMLAFIEQIARPGKVLRFRGQLTAFLCDDDEADTFEALMNKALRLIFAVGAMKSAGFGEVVHEGDVRPAIERTDIHDLAPALDGLPAHADTITFEVIFDRPIMFDAVHEADNLIVGQPVVPGAAVKGALARKLKWAGEAFNGGDLSRLVISHAFPLDSAGKQALKQPIPLCMASFMEQEGKFAFCAHLGLGDDALLENGQPPLYPPDWKREVFDAARERLGQVDEPLAQLQRTRVSIGEDGTAKDEALFTEVAVSERISGGKCKRRWRFTVHRNGIAEESFRTFADHIAAGLWDMGRTNAAMEIKHICAAPEPEVRSWDGDENMIALMLRTPAVMIDPLKLGESGRWEKEAHEAYADYWKEEVLGKDVELVDFMASQRWAGRYLGIRFRPYGKDIYYPFMLTEPGSVFMLRGPDLKDRVKKLLHTGLPHARLNGGEVSWETSPFVPGNGYGQVVCITRADIEGGAA